MKFNGKDITELLALNRRNFVKLILGGAVGTGLSPIPWKLADDTAIWTQNWPWVPVPPEGEYVHEKTICKLCPGGCGIEVRKVDHRAVKIEGRTDFPVNPGGMCPLGMGGLQLLYNEQIRFTSPMKRVGARGAGKFVSISWEEAMAILVDRIKGLRQAGQPAALASIDGNPGRSTMSVLIERFMNAVGSPNYMRIPTSEDTYSMANMLMTGNDGPMAYDLENADFILSFGSGLIEGWGSPGRVLNAWKIWKENAAQKKITIVQIESRASNTASKADQWIPVKPGTEAALALGIAHILIREKLYHSEFVDRFAFGFSDWITSDGKDRAGFRRLVLEKYSPEKVAEITGIDAAEIGRLADLFGRARAPIALCGRGKGFLPGSVFECMAIHALNALVGNLNTPGGIFLHDPLPLGLLPQLEPDAVAAAGLKTPRVDQIGGSAHPFSQSLIENFSDAVISAEKSPVDTLLCFSSNPAYTMPDGGAFNKALQKIPFVVSFSPYHDETAYMADLVLPDHHYLEKMDDVVWPIGLQYPLYGITKPVVNPLYDTRNTGDIIIRLAAQMGDTVGKAFPWKNYEEVLQVRAKGLFDHSSGLTEYNGPEAWSRISEGGNFTPDYKSFDEMWKKMISGNLWYRPAHRYGNWGGIFKTPTGKFEFFSMQIDLAVDEASRQQDKETVLMSMGIHAKGDDAFMPHFESLVSEEDHGHYPLKMVPYEMINLSSGPYPNPPYLNKTLFDNQLFGDESFIEINPRTAADYHLGQGDRVVVGSSRGEVQVRVNLFEGAMPGIVYMPLGFGHTAYDDFLRGKGVNPNRIIAGGRDPLSGYSIWWSTPVKLTKI
ncbi:MAG: molybdopterin-dependent oxidoreductase [Deltaproteobacteria bacterium]|nr:molybdopterin-dependent oxidoreductase [Deltaproteobacteria bacterium]